MLQARRMSVWKRKERDRRVVRKLAVVVRVVKMVFEMERAGGGKAMVESGWFVLF